jgi:hypothetical protein
MKCYNEAGLIGAWLHIIPLLEATRKINCVYSIQVLRGGADKSLGRQGRTQATATKPIARLA